MRKLAVGSGWPGRLSRRLEAALNRVAPRSTGRHPPPQPLHSTPNVAGVVAGYGVSEESWKTVNIHEAKTHLSRILSEVEKGEEYLLARAGKAIARLSPITEARTKPVAGKWKDMVTVGEDFDSEDERINLLFEGPPR